MSPAAFMLLRHLQAQSWMDHPSASHRRRRQSVAACLGLSITETHVAARWMAEQQAARGIKTIDTATLPGTLGGAP